jgi:hypothetical protein
MDKNFLNGFSSVSKLKHMSKAEAANQFITLLECENTGYNNRVRCHECEASAAWRFSLLSLMKRLDVIATECTVEEVIGGNSSRS